MRHKILALTLTALLCGCVEDDFDPGIDGGSFENPWVNQDYGNVPTAPSCPGQASIIQGTVFAPNGTDPVPGATVFVPAKTPELFPPAVKCEACASLGSSNNYWTTITKWNGSFVLTGVCPGTRSLIFQNGRFRRLITVKVGAKTTIKIPNHQSRLPRRNREFNVSDAIPKIAVATGDYDKMECVLRKMGLQDGTYDLFEGAKLLKSFPARPSFASLVNNLSKMKTYNIIFINCTDNTHEVQLKNSNVINNLQKYVQAGGRLYVTDWSYDWIEQVSGFAPFIDFEPGVSGSTPEPVNAAALGADGLKVQASIKDSRMAQWLTLFAGSINNGKSLIEHFLVDWVVMNKLHKEAKLWVEGTVRFKSGQTVHRPLTVTFNFKNCGKILFSSYHTEGRDAELKAYPLPAKPFPQYCGSHFSPQDRILEYLIFDIANCIKPID